MVEGNLGAHLSPALTDKLVKVLGMLGSDHDGEIAAAGRRANAMVKGAGLTWDEVLAPPVPIPQQPCRPPRRWRRPVPASDSAALCLQWPEVLTDWETDFYRSLVGKHRTLPRQTAVRTWIAHKVEGFARTSGEWG